MNERGIEADLFVSAVLTTWPMSYPDLEHSHMTVMTYANFADALLPFLQSLQICPKITKKARKLQMIAL